MNDGDDDGDDDNYMYHMTHASRKVRDDAVAAASAVVAAICSSRISQEKNTFTQVIRHVTRWGAGGE